MDTLGNCKEKMAKRTIVLRQGLNKVARQASGAWPAWRGGDFRSHRKPAGPAFRQPRTSAESPAAALKKSHSLFVRCLFPNLPHKKWGQHGHDSGNQHPSQGA